MSESLCETCRLVNFNKCLYQTTRVNDIWTNTWKQICERSSWCSLCRLVHKSLSDIHAPVEEDEICLRSHTSWRVCVPQNRYLTQFYWNGYDLKKHAKQTHTASRGQFRAFIRPNYLHRFRYHYGPMIRPIISGPFSGRRVDRNHADLELVREWLHICDTHHIGSCIPSNTSRVTLPIGFRLIDVKRNKILTELRNLNPRYVALTYVWGQGEMDIEMPLTLKPSVYTVEDRVELIDLPKLLPRTIGDAIEVTRSLGFTYLWVDSLCIIQDDREDRHNQINMMDEIYKNAALTIAAGSSPHANWGLHGISIPRTVDQQTESIGPYEFAFGFPSFETINSNHNLKYLTWNTRGWTLQEKILSKRLLLFTDIQMYFWCGNSSFAEDVAMETGPLSHNVRRIQNPLRYDCVRYDSQPGRIRTMISNALAFGLDSIFIREETERDRYLSTYLSLLEEYSQRDLTFKNDSLDAVSGVLRALDSSKLAFCAGLPRRYLPQALLWQPNRGCRYSIDYDARNGIPSWSWAGWSFAGGFTINRFGRHSHRPPMVIHYQDSEGRLSWSFEYWTSGTPNELLAKSWTELSATAQRHLELSGTLLGFQTCVGVFGIGDDCFGRDSTLNPEDECRTFYLIDEAGRRVGNIDTCPKVARKPGPHQFIALSTRNGGLGENTVDLIYQPKKSMSNKFTYTGCFHTHNRKVTKETSKEAVLPSYNWRVTNVMLVEWRDDVAFRVAVGCIISTVLEWKPERMVYLG